MSKTNSSHLNSATSLICNCISFIFFHLKELRLVFSWIVHLIVQIEHFCFFKNQELTLTCFFKFKNIYRINHSKVIWSFQIHEMDIGQEKQE